MAQVFRIFVVKKEGRDIEARHILEDLKTTVGITALEGLRVINRYDAEGFQGRNLTELLN
jgi:phosphoribosylformylglycinamidine synthase